MNHAVFKESIRLARKFPKKVVTHAVKDKKTFIRIFEDGQIRLPSQIQRVRKMTPYMEKVLGIENSIYLGLGFVYNSSHHNWPFAFIFDKNILQHSHITTYNAFLISNGWLRFLRKIKHEDPQALLKIRNKNERTRYEIDRLLKTDRCNWFHIEKELREVFDAYPYRKEHIEYIKSFQKSRTLKNTYAPRYLCIEYYLNPNFKKFEAVSKKPISLKDKNFIGVYIHASQKDAIEEAKKYLGKEEVIFTGKEIIKIV